MTLVLLTPGITATAIGRHSRTRSFDDHLRFRVTKLPGVRMPPAAWPLMVREACLHQPGIRRTRGKLALPDMARVKRMVSPNGYWVSSVQVASVPPATWAVTTEGT